MEPKAILNILYLLQFISFTGDENPQIKLNETELIQFLNSLDVYIHASFGETMSTAIMQAMACGLPIIASDVPGINNMIEAEKNGILVPIKNEVVLSEKMQTLISNYTKKDALSNQALEYAQIHFSKERMFQEYAQLFQSNRYG